VSTDVQKSTLLRERQQDTGVRRFLELGLPEPARRVA